MSSTSRILGSLALGLVLAVGSAWATTGSCTIQGNVKGPDGKPLSGAEVRLQRKDNKALAGTVKTDSHGAYIFKNLTVASYTLSVSANGMATTAAENIKARAEGATRIDFNLNRQGGSQTSTAKKKGARHMVWVPAQTGSNLGGRWVEVDDNGTTPTSGDHIQTIGQNGVNKMQSNSGATLNASGGN